MTDLTIEDELDLIKGRKPAAAAPAVPGATAIAATTPPEDEVDVAAIDAELGLPPAERDLGKTPEVADTWDVMSAAWRNETVRTDAWNYSLRKRRDLINSMYDVLPADAKERVNGKSWSEARGWSELEYSVLAEVAQMSATLPQGVGMLGQYPMTMEDFDKRINDERRAEIDQSQAVLDQDGGAIAEFVGAGGRAMTDATSLMLLPLGVSGTAWRMIAGEAVLGAVSEAVVLPREFEVADELGLDAPDVASRLALGAVLGGGLAGAVIGIGRGASRLTAHVKARRDGLAATKPGGADTLDHQVAVDTAEAALRGDQTVQETLAAKRPPAVRAPEAVTVEYDLAGKTRDKPVSDGFLINLRTAVAPLGDDVGVTITSGGQDPAGTPGAKRTGSNRHDVGPTGQTGTADVVLTRNGKPVSPAEDPELYERFLYQAGGLFPGVGHYDWGIHVGGGSVAAWGPDTTSATLNPRFGAAINAGRQGKTDWAATAPPRIANTSGLDYNEDATIGAIIGAESSGKVNAANENSSARGLGQVLEGTWMELVRKHRPDLLTGRTPNEVLALRDDAAINTELTKAYGRDNHAALKAAGIKAGPAEIYLAHFLGPSGAIKALRATLADPINSVVGPKQISANASIRFNGKSFANFTVYDLQMWARSKMRSAYGDGAPVGGGSSGPTSRGYTGSGQVAAGEKYKIDVDYEVVDAISLIRASGDLQPRDRSRGASDAWISDTAARLDPAQLMRSPTADRGAPLVGPDSIIESGNGRFAAISRAYDLHPDRAAAYRAQIEAEGFAIPDGIERPVLVARRRSELTEAERRDLVVVAQDSGVAAMSATEQAAVFGRAMTSPTLAKLDPTQPLGAEANSAFVRAAIDRLPRSMRGALYDADQRLSKAGVTQLKDALFARAWPDPDIIARYSETDAGELKSLLDALEAAAPNWAALRNDIEAGLVDEAMDISPFVLDAMRLIGAARDLSAKSKLPVSKALEDLLNDVDLLAGAISPLTTALVRKFWRNGRAAPADEIAGFLGRYADDARKVGATGAMFDVPSPRDVLVAIDAKGFADLPADLGTARGYARPGQDVPVAALPDLPARGFEKGAASAEAVAVADEIEADLRGPAAESAPDRAPELQADAALNDLVRLRPAFADFEIDLPDGTKARVGAVLDDLTDDAQFDAFVQACAISPAGGAQ